MSLRMLPVAMLLAFTVGAPSARANKVLPIEQRAASQKVDAAKVRGLSINPMSSLNATADRSLRTPEVKEAMHVIVRYLKAARTRGADRTLAVIVGNGGFGVARNGKIYGAGPSLKHTVRASDMNESSAASVAFSIKAVASKIERGEKVQTRELHSPYGLW